MNECENSCSQIQYIFNSKKIHDAFYYYLVEGMYLSEQPSQTMNILLDVQMHEGVVLINFIQK